MKNEGVDDRFDGEKHNLEYLFVALVDGHGRAIWSSRSEEYTGQSILDVVVESERSKAKAALTRCLLDGKTVGYNITLIEGQERWRVTMMPARYHDIALGVALCSRLHASHEEITDEERQMLSHLGDDLTLKEIAQRLHRSESAIDSRIKILKAKMGCRNLSGLVASAIRGGLI